MTKLKNPLMKVTRFGRFLTAMPGADSPSETAIRSIDEKRATFRW